MPGFLGALQATPAEPNREVNKLLDWRAGLSDTIVSLGISILETDGDASPRARPWCGAGADGGGEYCGSSTGPQEGRAASPSSCQS